MASSRSPNQPSQPSGGDGILSQVKRPLSSLPDFVRTLAERRTTRDGPPQKRRGPKPDSKPALTRRQELNRQAQRTHRERKERYIKALEDEVLRLRGIVSNVSQDKERLAEENRHLKALLAQNGIGVSTITTASSVPDESISNPSVGYTSSASIAGSYAPMSSDTGTFTPPPMSASTIGSRGGGVSPNCATYPQRPSAGVVAGGQPDQRPSLDYEQAGIHFVLTLEKPCMSHLPFLLERNAQRGSGEPCRHALMASCPPDTFDYSNVTTTTTTTTSSTSTGGGGGGRTWEPSKADLATLLDLSARLDLDGEITPVMAWGMVLAHPRLAEFRAEDFARLTDELSGKIRCYDFGAVMEEFEVRDALENVFSTKPEPVLGY
ncbi:hypothetical protein VTK56DRAFT_9347 [Thermocarpiscus australiensis]